MSDNYIQATDDSLKDLYGKLPVLIYLHNGENQHKAVTDAATKTAKKYSDELVIASVNISENPTTAAKYQHLGVPAVVTMEKKLFGMREKSSAGEVRPSDLRDHAAYLLDKGEDPAVIAERKAAKQANKGNTSTSGTTDVSERTFKRDVLKSKVPVLVDFWAPWCGPCRQVSPMLEQLGQEYKGKIRVVKVNVDDNQGLSRKYNIMSIPTMMIFKGGAIVQQTKGAQPRHVVQRMIEDSLD